MQYHLVDSMLAVSPSCRWGSGGPAQGQGVPREGESRCREQPEASHWFCFVDAVSYLSLKMGESYLFSTTLLPGYNKRKLATNRR